MTTVLPDGSKQETKVFAGGTVITTQVSGVVAWMTADPVTGTVGKFGYYNGASAFQTEETEPLGQTLRQHDPAEPPQPPPSDPGPIGSADDPHWQCTAGEQFYGGFSGMPFHCQKAILQDFSRGLDEIFGFSNPHRPDNPTRVSVQVIGGVDSPVNVPSIPFMDSSAGKSPTNLALAKMLQSTAKPNDDKDKPKIVAEVNIPISFDKDELIDMSDTGVVDASQSGDDDWRSPFHFFTSDEKLSDEDCDFKLSRIFGGVAKAMEKAGDIDGLDRSAIGFGHSATPTDGYRTIGGKRVRNSQAGGIIHTYTDEKASKRTDVSLYTPGGWSGVTPYFTGGNSGLIFNYSNGITIEFVHVGTNNKSGSPSIPKNVKAGELAEIGYIGGAGGASIRVDKNGISYNHTHIVFFSNKPENIRIDPRKLFCGW